MDSKEIGKKIAKLRESKGLSQKDLAGMIPISQSNLSRWESGSLIPSFQYIDRICDIFDVSLDHFLIKDKEEYNGLRKKLFKVKILSIVLSILLLLILAFILLPQYRIVDEKRYHGDYGDTLAIYVKPLFYATETSADSYGRKLSKKYYGNTDLEAVEVVFVRPKGDLSAEDDYLFTILYYIQPISE